MKDNVLYATSLTPASVSPVLKSRIEIALESSFPYTLDKEDFTVNATSLTNSTYIRYLNVVAVDDDARTLTCLFGGAYSGEFQISVRHSHYGRLGTDGRVLDVSASVDSFSPQIGSIYGGTLLTIQGNNFGDEITDNPV